MLCVLHIFPEMAGLGRLPKRAVIVYTLFRIPAEMWRKNMNEDIIKMDAINEILDRIDGKFDNQDKQYLTGYTLFDKYIQIRP